jgi:cytochrome c biogenesis protein CcdA
VESNKDLVIIPGKLKSRSYLLLHAIAFVFGFSLIFVIGWGGATTILGQLFVSNKIWIARVGGLVLIVFGLATMDIIHIPWFYMDTRKEYKGLEPSGAQSQWVYFLQLVGVPV